MIFINKHSLYELPNDLRLRILKKLGNIRKIAKLHRNIAYCSVFLQKKVFFSTSKGTPLDISKALGKIWHERFTFKLKQSGISGDLLKTLSGVLSNRNQIVVLN